MICAGFQVPREKPIKIYFIFFITLKGEKKPLTPLKRLYFQMRAKNLFSHWIVPPLCVI